MMAVHHALETTALGHAGHLHDVSRLEDRHADRLPRLRLRSGGAFRRRRNREALQHAWHDLETRSEEHTSELQSQSNLVCRLLLEKKKSLAKIRQFVGSHII